jgi:hypothetical protein
VLREEGKQREREVPPEQKHQEKIRPIERGKKKQRRKGIGTSQGLKRKIRKLQGPICKVKFSIDLKPE